MTTVRSRFRHALVALALLSTAVLGVAAAAPADAGAAVFCRGWEATWVGTPGDDVYHGTAGRDVIVALAGNDTIYGHGGNDIICGNYGDDVIYGNRGHDRIYGGGGNDELRGGGGNDRIWGQRGNDTVYGGHWLDICHGETEYACEVDSRNGPWTKDMWRDLVDEFFGDIGKTDDALRIIDCESNFDPYAINPRGERPVGLWQFIPSTWEWATPNTGWSHETRMHPRAATATARWLYDWAAGRTRQDGSDGQGFDPWVSCRCQLPDYRDLDACIPYR